MKLKQYKGSMTVEASFVLPIFFFVIMFFVYFFVILSMQTIVGESLLQTGKFLSEYGAIKETDDLLLYADFQKNLKLNSLNCACIKGGELGIRLVCEDTSEREEVILSALYDIKIPVLIFRMRTISAKQTLKTRFFVGKSMKNDCGNGREMEQEKKDVIVYITENGTVYHKSKTCSHLQLSIKPISFTMVEQARNIGGAKYKQCERCKKNLNGKGIVFITLEGNRYHTSLQCSGLKRTITEISLDRVKDWDCCKRCG